MSFLRTSLIPGLSKASDLNIKNNKRDFRIFELGNVHERIGSGLKGIKEEKYLALIIHGMQNRKSLFNEDIAEDLFNLKGTLIAVFSSRFNLKIEFIEKDYIGFDHSYVIKINKQEVGALGIISDKILRKMEIDIDILFGCEINLTPIQKMLKGKKVFNSINIYPKIKRDLNFILSEKQEVGPISDLIIKVGKGIITFCNPTNIYKDPVLIGENLKSVTYSIEFQHHSRTLEEKDVSSIIQEIISSANTQFDAILRT
jgi:phenylalanyl-tRNA synthetase beta chain